MLFGDPGCEMLSWFGMVLRFALGVATLVRGCAVLVFGRPTSTEHGAKREGRFAGEQAHDARAILAPGGAILGLGGAILVLGGAVLVLGGAVLVLACAILVWEVLSWFRMVLLWARVVLFWFWVVPFWLRAGSR